MAVTHQRTGPTHAARCHRSIESHRFPRVGAWRVSQPLISPAVRSAAVGWLTSTMDQLTGNQLRCGSWFGSQERDGESVWQAVL